MTQQSLSRRRALGTAAATGLAALFTAGAARAASSARPAPLAAGTYTIALGPGNLLTAGRINEPLVILPPGHEAQEWEVVALTHGNIALRNLGGNVYMGHQGTFHPHRFAVATTTPFEWGLAPSGAFGGFRVTAPGSDLVLGQSPLLVSPLRVDLQYRREADLRQAWQFRPVTN
ncbi:hypothetical protein [Streptomyces cadmiisoli]|uniref:Twin-arginine translocation signal domain-containing protein n=1 Tax=Streptomyces cadmiisoli TaxID=2184053 RepID=A0A2Z4J1W8_9ACTN|nr:hypothetical protein [Streptomyces cadmiisoli]AWW39129.1 hypothetical protein DN051_22770 [Streptomyces cadmiisoli]